MAGHRYSGATQRIMHPENENASLIVPRSIILHTFVDPAGRTDMGGYLDREDVPARVQFVIHRDGEIVQLMDANRRGAASGAADSRAISVETEDDSSARGSDVLGLTDAQVEAFIRLCEWAMATYPTIPRRSCTAPTGPGADGIGFHSQPMRERWEYRQSNGIWHNSWTSFQGKICPGDRKVDQYYNVIMPRLLGNTPVPTPVPPAQGEDDDMGYAKWDDGDKLSFVIDMQKILHEQVVQRVTGSVHSGVNDPVTNLGDLYNQNAAMLAALGSIKPGGNVDPVALAGAIVDALGDDVAKKVADELGKRLDG